MKNILLATDFSPNAYIAALCAAELSNRFGGRLILFHALSPIYKVDNECSNEDGYGTEEAAQKKLDALAHELHSKFNISVSRLLKPGYADDEIPWLAGSLNAELVILGAKGESNSSSKWLGNISNKLIEDKDLPVVCVPSAILSDLSLQLGSIIMSKPRLCNTTGLSLLNFLNTRLS